MANPFQAYQGSGVGNDLAPYMSGSGGSNQYMSFPMPTATPMGTPASTGGGYVPPSSPYTGYQFPFNNLTGQAGSVGAADKLPGGAGTTPTLDPLFTQDLDSFLQTQMGQGISPFSLSAFLPSTGGYTQPGQVSAPLTPLLTQLSQFLQTGQGGGAGASALGSLAQNGGLTGMLGSLGQTGGLTGALGQFGQTGMPTDVGPEWQAMIQSQQNNIAQNQANLKEQFGSMGDLSSSSAANAMSLFNAQTAADQNSLLGQLQANASESAAGRQLSALQGGVGTQLNALQGGVGTQLAAGSQLQQLASQLGVNLQGLDQQSIQALMQEYFQTTPQENPLNNEMFGLGTTFAPTYTKQGGVGSGLIGSLPSMIGGAASGISSAGGGVLDTILGALGGI